jgi:hypothetical protein
MDKFLGDLGAVHTKVDLAMTSINLVQQEQVHVAKLVKANSASSSASAIEGVMGLRRSGYLLHPRDLYLLHLRLPHPHPQVNRSLPNPTTTILGDSEREDTRKQWMPKMDFPVFDGSDARIWVDKCESYFVLYQIPVAFRVSVASIHLTGSATHWYQSYKDSADFQRWDRFAQAVVTKFEFDTHREKMMELLSLRQTRLVEEYRKCFDQLVYNIRLYDRSLSETMLTSQFLLGLKDDIRHHMGMILSESVAKATVLASVQEHLLSSVKRQGQTRGYKGNASLPKAEAKGSYSAQEMWQARQLKDFHRQNGLCFRCGDKYVPRHKCATTVTGVPPTQLSNIEGADGGMVLSDAMLDLLETENTMDTDKDCYMSLNAISGTQSNRVIHLRALVGKQVLLILVDSGRSHTFLNSNMLHLISLQPIQTQPMKVKVANGQVIQYNKEVKGLQWWIQGCTFVTDARVVESGAYDLILGMDWLEAHIPM